MAGSVLKAIAEKIDVGKVGEFESLHTQMKALSREQVLEFFLRVQSQLPRARRSDSYFSYAANAELSGFSVGYPTLKNRTEKLKQVCYFAATYADQLVLWDPFSRVLKNINTTKINSKFVSEFSFFLSNLIMMDPLMEKGIITFADAAGDFYCADCLHKLIKESDPRALNMKNSMDVLLREAQVRLVSIDSTNQECIALIEGPADIFGEAPHEVAFRKQGRLLTNKDVGKIISRRKLEKLGILFPYFKHSTIDAVTKANISKRFGINRNFASSSEISLLKRTFGEKHLSSSSFESDAPILMANSLHDLILLRENEWHHFEKFRNALHATTDDLMGADLERIYRETVIPEMINIERIIEKNRRVSGKEIIKSSGVAVITLTTTVMTAGLSTLLSAAAGVLGGGHFVKRMIPALHDYINVPDEAKDSQFYYAWKIKKNLRD